MGRRVRVIGTSRAAMDEFPDDVTIMSLSKLRRMFEGRTGSGCGQVSSLIKHKEKTYNEKKNIVT